MEIWKDINGYWDYYQVSQSGVVRSLDREISIKGGLRNIKGVVLKYTTTDRGYLSVGLSKYGNRENFRVHQLVAKEFIPNPLNLVEVNHKDGDKSNNNSYNLEWCTRSENILHAYDIGMKIAKLSEDDVERIKNSYPAISQTQLAQDFNVSRATIQNAIKGKNCKRFNR